MKAQDSLTAASGDAFRKGDFYYQVFETGYIWRPSPVVLTWRFERAKPQSACAQACSADSQVYEFTFLGDNGETCEDIMAHVPGERAARVEFLDCDGLLNALLCWKLQTSDDQAIEGSDRVEDESELKCIVVKDESELQSIVVKDELTCLELQFAPSHSSLKQLRRCVNLRELRASWQFHDELIPALRDTHITRLCLLQSSVTDKGLEFIAAHLPHLKTLHVSHARVSNEGVRSLERLSDLEELMLDSTLVDDAACGPLSDLPELRRLNISCVPLTDTGLSQLCQAKQLLELGIAGTDITDEGLQIIENWASLRMILLAGTRITHDGLRRLMRARPDLDVRC